MSYLNNQHSLIQDLRTLGLDGTKKVEHNDIKKAFRDLSLKFHPDKQPKDSSEAEKANAKEQFEEIGNANDRLLEKCPKGKTIDPISNSGSSGGFDFPGFDFGSFRSRSDNKQNERNSGSKNSGSSKKETIKNPTKDMLHAFKTEKEVSVEKLKKLIKDGAKLDAIDEDGNNVLILSAAKGNARCVKFLTQDSLVKINAKNKDGDTALRVAANNGHQDVVERLIERGADIDAVNAKGHTALIGATCQGHLNIVKILLNKDAKTDITGKDGNNLNTCARSSGNQDVIKLINELDKLKNPEKSLLEALKNKEEIDINFVKKILAEKSFDIEYKNDNGENALFLASNHHYQAIVELLISKGANVNAFTNEHKTPLMNAACSALTGTVKALLGAGAKTDVTATSGLTIERCAQHCNEPQVHNLVREYSNYQNNKISSNEALISAVSKGDKQAAQEIVKEQVHQILSHDHYAKVAIADVKQVFESDHLHQLNDELIAVQSCLLGLNNDYYENLESICGMSS